MTTGLGTHERCPFEQQVVLIREARLAVGDYLDLGQAFPQPQRVQDYLALIGGMYRGLLALLEHQGEAEKEGT